MNDKIDEVVILPAGYTDLKAVLMCCLREYGRGTKVPDSYQLWALQYRTNVPEAHLCREAAYTKLLMDIRGNVPFRIPRTLDELMARCKEYTATCEAVAGDGSIRYVCAWVPKDVADSVAVSWSVAPVSRAGQLFAEKQSLRVITEAQYLQMMAAGFAGETLMWLVHCDKSREGGGVEVIAMCSTKANALKACVDGRYSMWPFPLDAMASEETWSQNFMAWFPHSEPEPEAFKTLS